MVDPMARLDDPRIDPELLEQRDLDRLPPGLFEWRVAEVVNLASRRAARGEAQARALARWQDDIIVNEIQRGASVLDLGCGDGQLLERLESECGAHGHGVEIDLGALLKAVRRGVSVLHADLNEGLRWFPDQSFDYVVLEETLQTVQSPRVVLSELLRVGRRGIVSFPNFANWRVIVDFVAHGRMPVTSGLPFPWYASENIHPFTLQDLLDWADSSGVQLVSGHSHADGLVRPLRPEDNLHAEAVLVVLQRK
jgi:methionine biosynthesis protein MetW